MVARNTGWLFICSIVLAVASVVHAQSGVVRVWQSSAVTGDRLRELPPFTPYTPDTTSKQPKPSVLKFHTKDEMQTIVGFGGAITEASVTVLAAMPEAKQREVIDAYFGEQGNQYSIARLHINSCDFSVNSWNFDPFPDDFDLVHFDRNLTHDQQYLLPFLRKVLKSSHHELQIFASPWSPPAWMKGNNAMVGSSQPCLKSDPEQRYHRAWAKYLSKWISAYEEALDGYKLWGLTVQNEPEYAAPWEACTYTAEETRDFIRDHLQPVLQKEHPHLKLMAFDHNKDHVAIWAQTLYSDPRVRDALWGLGIHWYSGDEFHNLQLAHQLAPEKHLLATEATHVNGIRWGDFSRAEAYAHDIIGDLNAWVEGWTDWNIVLDTQGGPNHLNNWCDAGIIADPTKGELIYQPMYYAMAHFSRFLPPNKRSIRVRHEWMWSPDRRDQPARDLELVAFKVKREDETRKVKDDKNDKDEKLSLFANGADMEEDEYETVILPVAARSAEYVEVKRKKKKHSSRSKKEEERKHKHSKRDRSSSSSSLSSSSSSSSSSSDPKFDVVLLMLNRQDTPAEYGLALNGGKQQTVIPIPPHSIQTVVFDADML